MAWAFDLALLNAGSSIAARIAIIAMTTSNSIRVNARAGNVKSRPEPDEKRLDFNASLVMGSLGVRAFKSLTI